MEHKVPSSLLDEFRKDEQLQPFLERDFDATQYTSYIIKGPSVSASYQKLTDGVNQLDKELNTQVALHHEELLSQVSKIKDLEAMLEVVKTSIDSLQTSIDRVASEISEPSSLIRARTVQLSRLHTACEILRKVIRFLYLARKLKGHIQGGTRELSKAAQCILELETLRKEGDLVGIHAIDTELRWIVKAGEDVMNSASRMLLQGMETQNQAEVAASLQVFHNLRTLKSKVDSTVELLSKKVSQAIRTSLVFTQDDLQAKEGLRTLLWSRLDKAIEILHVCCVQLWHLQRVLTKLRDPITNECLVDEVVTKDVKGGAPLDIFWKSMTLSLKEHLEASAKKTPIVDQTFISEFPKLHRMFQEFLKRLAANYELKQGPEETAMLFNSMVYFKSAYLQRAFGRLFEATNKMLASNSVPSSEEISNIVGIMTNELETARSSSEDLAVDIARHVVTKGLKLFATKIEGMISTDPSAYQVTDGFTPHQVRNAKLLAALYQLFNALMSFVNPMNPATNATISEPLRDLENLGGKILSPLFARITRLTEQTIYTMHKEDFGKNTVQQADNQECSQFMKLLQRQIAHFQGQILSHFMNNWTTGYVRHLALRIVTVFVRHAALVRPLGEAGKLKLAADMAQVELAVAPLYSVKELGYPYRALRALRPLLFRETSEIEKCPEVNILLPSTVLHHLFSRAASSLQSPHIAQGWSLVGYSEWLDKHSEEDVWAMISKTLESYASQVNARGEKEFTAVYPVMLSLGPKLVSMWKDNNKS